MAPSISHTVESESQITAASLKVSSTTEEVLLDNPVEAAQDPALVDPLAPTTSVPSSDDDMDENGSIDGSADNASDTGADVTPTVVAVAAAAEVAAETTEVVADTTTIVDVAADETSDFDNEVAAVTSFAEGFSLEDRTSTVKAPVAIERTQTSSTPSSPSSTPQPIPVPAVEALIAAASTIVGEEGHEPRKSLSRPLSRQELRRKSSFFNSKDIAISDQRFSSSTSASMRPIADPRFKSRFQNILSQWKARASE